MIAERWAPIDGYVGRYEVSDMGRVRSVTRYVRHVSPQSGKEGVALWKGKILALHTWGAPYPGIVLNDEFGKSKRFAVHQLVAEAFIPNPHGYRYIGHTDNNGLNPVYTNLEWLTQSKNMKDAHATGRRPMGKEHHFAKLKRDEFGRCLLA